MHRQGTKVLAQTTLETGAVAPCSVGKLLAMEPSGIARKSAFWSSSTWFCAGKGGLVEIYPTTTTTIVNWKRYVLSIHWFTCTYLSVYLYNYRFGYLMLLIYSCIFISVICLFGCVFVCWFIHSRTHPGVIFKTLSGIVWDLPRIYPRNISMFLSKAACKYGLRTCLMKALDDILSQPKIIWSPPKNPRHFTIFTWMLHSSQGLGRLGSPRPLPTDWCHPCKRACKSRWVPKPQTATQHPRHRIHGHEKYVEPLHWRLNLNADLIWVWLILYDV